MDNINPDDFMAEFGDRDPILENDIETLNANLAEASGVYESLVNAKDEDEENLVELDRLATEQLRLYNETREKIKEIERKRYQRSVEIRKAEREKDKAEMLVEEARKLEKLNQSRAESFRDMMEYAKKQNFAWVDVAKTHQWEGALTLAHHGDALLADEAGLGKTLTVMAYADLVNCGYRNESDGNIRLGAKKVIVFVPANVVGTFTKEIQRRAPHRQVLPLSGPNPTLRKLANVLASTMGELTIVVNYEAVWRDVSWISEIDWDIIVVDEAHNMKNVNGLTFDRVSQLKTKHFLPMTGTPILNEPKDLYAPLHLIDPQAFDDSYTFLYSYCQQNDKGKWEFQPGGEKRMMRALKGRILQRKLADTDIELPTQYVRELIIEPEEITEEQTKIMKQLKEYAGIALDNGESMNVNAMIALITRERQAATFPAGISVKMTEKMHEESYPSMFENGLIPPVGTILFQVPEDTPSIKIDKAVARLKAVIATGKRGVVFSQFKTALVGLEARLEKEGIRVARYDGDTKMSQRYIIEDDFRREPDGKQPANYKYDVVLAHYKVGGVGLNFTAATYMLKLDEEWNPGKNDQSHKRINRIGQTEETLVEVMRIKGSIDMWMKTLNDHKQAVIEGFNDEVSMVESFKQYLDSEILSNKKTQAEIDAEFEDLLKGF